MSGSDSKNWRTRNSSRPVLENLGWSRPLDPSAKSPAWKAPEGPQRRFERLGSTGLMDKVKDGRDEESLRRTAIAFKMALEAARESQESDKTPKRKDMESGSKSMLELPSEVWQDGRAEHGLWQSGIDSEEEEPELERMLETLVVMNMKLTERIKEEEKKTMACREELQQLQKDHAAERQMWNTQQTRLLDELAKTREQHRSEMQDTIRRMEELHRQKLEAELKKQKSFWPSIL